MFGKQTYTTRRRGLRELMKQGGVILLTGNMESPYNYKNNAYAFRQDSTFLYYFGHSIPNLVGVIDVDNDTETLYGNDATVDDIIWTGPLPTVKELGAQVGVEDCQPLSNLAEVLANAIRHGRKVHFLPPYRAETKLQLSSLLGLSTEVLSDYMSDDLILAVAAMREVKSSEELEELERAFEIGYQMHTTAMKMCRVGVVEQEIAGALEGIAKTHGAGVSFHSIVSQHGETLHNHTHSGVLEAGRLLLVDAGGETVNNYCSDHTRTLPVGGKFTERQKDIYNVVLSAHDWVARTAKAGMLYNELHHGAYKVMAEGLCSLGLIKGSAEDAVEAGVMTLFMPHGLGHGLGLDVHDCEAFGERSFNYNLVAERAEEVGACVMRSKWRLRAGTVMTDEPGIYFIPALIEKWKHEGLDKGLVNYDLLKEYYDFGGIRLEDDLVITDGGCYMIGRGKHIPITVEQVEEYMR